MIHFECDYTGGCPVEILSALTSSNQAQTVGYSEDEFCERARLLIQKACAAPDSDVHFLVGGTQANLTVISSILRPWQGVLCAETGHINIHETGAIEARGHKVISLPSEDGKISGSQIRNYVNAHWGDATHEHIAQPGMVYISAPTENGTHYSKAELEDISMVCHELGLPLYVDGARMGYGLVSPGNDMTLPDFARLCDVFYIGGTKVGALFGEAVVICNPALKKDFRYMIKQCGGLLAKGRLLGIQFCTLFEDGLYFRLAQHAIDEAQKLKKALEKKGYSFLYNSPTNQLFPIMPKTHMKKLQEHYLFYEWSSVDESHSAVRFCTSWSTDSQDIASLIKDIESL